MTGCGPSPLRLGDFAGDIPRLTRARSAPYENLRVLRAFVVNPTFLILVTVAPRIYLLGSFTSLLFIDSNRPPRVLPRSKETHGLGISSPQTKSAVKYQMEALKGAAAGNKGEIE
jgi:hypothetical protein